MNTWLNTIKRWLEPSIIEDETKPFTTRLLYAILAISLGSSLLFFILAVIVPQQAVRFGFFAAASIVINLLLFVLTRRGHTQLVSWVAVSLFWLIVTAAIITSGGSAILPYIAYLTLIIIAGLLLGISGSLIFTGLTIIIVILVTAAKITGLLPPVEATLPPLAFMIGLIFQFITVMALQIIAIMTIQNALNKARQEMVERQRVEEALRQSEKRYRQLVSYSSDPIFSLDNARHYQYVNEAFARRAGKPPEEIIGKTSYDIYPEAEARRRVELVNQVFETGETHQTEAHLTTASGEVRHYFTVIDPIKDKEGRVVRVMGIARDITERKRVEEALKESEKILNTIANNSNDVIWIRDLDFNYKYISPLCEKILGYPVEELMKLRYDQIVAPAYYAKVMALYAEEMALEKNPQADPNRTRLVEVQERHREGHLVWTETQASFIRDDQGQATSILGVTRDVSERKQAETALREQQNFIQRIADTVPGILYVYDLAEQRNVFANRTVLNYPSQPLPEMGQNPLTNLMHPDDRAKMPETLKRFDSLAEGEILELEFRLKSTTGDWAWLHSWNTVLALTPEGRPTQILGIAQDITRQKQVEVEREQLITELENKNFELERFTYTVSHDLKSPLITISGFLGFLEKDALSGHNDRVKADVTRIKEAAEKMRRLLDDLLKLSRIGRLMNPPQTVPFADLAQEAVRLVAGQLEARQIQVEIAPDLPSVYGDRMRLVEALQNLIDNAVKFMGEQPQPRLQIGVKPGPGETIFYVQDNGSGIEPRYQEEIFGLFKRLDTSTEGTGIGLALVKRIVEVHGGRIWVESEGLGRGATFCFTLAPAPAIVLA